ncbi:MAG: quinolinate synthase [Elusimicrobia bacterium RIFCSPLOWO2_01_FULL_59_12]|nr:MAG: quinolinate synthase [Elusimicrobia bacterium RIFCSPLOWO2_01_FULL_59_12]
MNAAIAKLQPSLQDQILALKKERGAIILAHNYQAGDVQDVADFVGDSLGLSQKAAQSDAPLIVFCGVHFMAETASILCPDKKVLIPDPEAGCSLSDMITVPALRQWKAEHPGAVVVAYVNTSAAVKAESDICCTSSNAVKVVESIPKEKEILFIPDMYLGSFVREKTGRKIHLWPGYCGVHSQIPADLVERMKREHPGAEVLIHPECGCLTPQLMHADQILSTEGIARRPAESKAREFIVATETGILHRLVKTYPDRTFIPILGGAVCGYMKRITLEKVLWSLEDLQVEVKVPAEIAAKAKRAIDRMMAIG